MNRHTSVIMGVALFILGSCASHDDNATSNKDRDRIQTDVIRFVTGFDQNRDRKLSYNEFLVSYQLSGVRFSSEQAKDAFDGYDGNHDGYIETEEMIAFGERALQNHTEGNSKGLR